MKHYLQFIQDTMWANWNEPALTDYEGSYDYTYGDLAIKVRKLQLLFDVLGILPGDKIAICGRNSANWAVAYMSIAAARCVAVSILPEFTSDSIHQLVNHSEAKLLFVGPWVKGRIDTNEMPNVESFIGIEDLKVMQSKKQVNEEEIEAKFNTLYPNGYTARDVHMPTDNMDEVALINYTSGSTGSPKGVMLTHRNLSSNVVYAQANIPNRPGLTYVSMLPLAHMFGLMFECIYQLAGGTHVYFITKSLNPVLLLKAFQDVGPYMILTVPLVIEKIFKRKIFPTIQKPLVKALWFTPLINIPIRKKVYRALMQAFGGKLQFLIIGGAALNEEVEQCMRQIHFPYTCGYGMTECAPLLCYEHWSKYAFKSCGKVIDRCEIRIDSDNPRKVPGEILVRGENVMRGYYKNIQATDNVFTDDGWMRTGDIGVLDRKGNLYLRGRSKNMILGASGQNIYPEEIEDKLNSMDGVAESVIVERDGKLIGLVFPEMQQIEDNLEKITQLMNDNLQKLNKLLPGYSKVSDIEIVEKEFEKTPKKSIKRFLYK
ncbi:MAG: AMP-binding protein [Bacteroidales bacterium]|nr:AMP-binding protein [Candidatus Colicola caccequi]MCQ2328457.1 AMP-binding protein [Paludibacteraceae bacterium]